MLVEIPERVSGGPHLQIYGILQVPFPLSHDRFICSSLDQVVAEMKIQLRMFLVIRAKKRNGGICIFLDTPPVIEQIGLGNVTEQVILGNQMISDLADRCHVSLVPLNPGLRVLNWKR